jgi:LPS-assembly protein
VFGRAGAGVCAGHPWQVLQASESFIARRPTSAARRWAHAWGAAGRLALRAGGRVQPLHAAARPGSHDAAPPGGRRLHLLGSLSHPLRANRLVAGAQAVAQRGFLQRQRLRWPLRRRQSVPRHPQLQRGRSAWSSSAHRGLRPRPAPDAGAALLYVNTPYREQSGLPNYDSAAKDFNFVSLYATTRSRASTACPTRTRSRPASRRGWWTPQRRRGPACGRGAALPAARRSCVTPQADGTPDGEPLTQRLSDALLLAPPACCRAGRWTLPCSTAPRSRARCAPSSAPLLARAVSHRRWHLPLCPRPERAAGAGLAVAAVRRCRRKARWPRQRAAAVAPGIRWAASTTA